MTAVLTEMTSLLNFSVPATMTNMLEMAANPPGLIVAQMARWLPTWLTPIWVIAAGLLVGAAVCLVVYGILALLSFVPGLGNLADSPKRGITASPVSYTHLTLPTTPYV